MQGNLVKGVAKECIQGLLNATQRRSQFVNDASHDLAIADSAVQLLHPGLKRLGLTARIDMLHPGCETGAARLHLRVSRVQVVVGSLQIQHHGSNFHGKCGRRRLTRQGCLFNCLHQCPHQIATFWVHFQH